MNLSILDVKNYLNQDIELKNLFPNTFPYLLNVPKMVAKIENLPIMRINQVSDYEDKKASNKAYTSVFSVQIDFWSTKLKDIEMVTPILDRIMNEHNYSQNVGDLSIDPDFNAEVNVYRLARRYKTTIVKSTL